MRVGIGAAVLSMIAAGPAMAGASNPACDVNASSGFKVCVSYTNPVDLIAVYLYHATGKPYRFGAFNFTQNSWQGGPWWRYSYGQQEVVWKADLNVNWNGIVRHQVDNQGTGTPSRYNATIG